MTKAVERAAEIRQYTQGDCVVFAVEAAAVTGGQPVFITDDDGETGHAMCLLPDGRLLDVRGVFAPGSLHEHCPAQLGGHVYLGRNARGVIEHEEMGLPEPAVMPLSGTRHGREHDEADYGDRVFARMAAERIWNEGAGEPDVQVGTAQQGAAGRRPGRPAATLGPRRIRDRYPDR